MPEILPAKSLGFTTQKMVPSVRSGPAWCVVATVTTTCVWSGESARLFTVPKTMSLYFSCDWPACSPSPPSNVILIVGPSLESVSQASQAPIPTATSGTIQMIDSRRERRVAACGTVRDSARLVMASLQLDRCAVLNGGCFRISECRAAYTAGSSVGGNRALLQPLPMQKWQMQGVPPRAPNEVVL